MAMNDKGQGSSAIHKLGAFVASLVMGAWALTTVVLNTIGAMSTIHDLQTQGLGFKLLSWLFSTPPMVPGAACLLITAWLFLKAGPSAQEAAFTVPGFGGGGAGGNASVKGSGTAIGGKGGDGNVFQSGGPGGDAHLETDNALLIGGNGGHGGTPDGRGGRPARGPMYGNAAVPSDLWKYGGGGAGANDPEYNRRLEVLTEIRSEYLTAFPQEAPFVYAGIDQVPVAWVNKRLEERSENWRVGGTCCYVMPSML